MRVSREFEKLMDFENILFEADPDPPDLEKGLPEDS
jgi:hypothetical protein